jgi:hypothetical protein
MQTQRLLRGTYLLEFSLVTFAIAAFSIAALDLLTLYRTRSALQVAIDTGLRCLYPVDADCRRGGSMSDDDVAGLVDVYHSINPNQPLPPQYTPVEQWQASVSADWYQVPLRRVGLESVSFIEPRPEVPALIEYESFPVTSRRVSLAMISALPRIEGSVFNERFVRSGDVGGLGQTPVGGVGGSTDRVCPSSDYDPSCLMASPSIGSVNAILNPRELDGFRGPLPCPGQTVDGECRVPAYILVRGRSSGVAEARGKLTLEIEYTSDKTRQLGGRLFASAHEAHLVPRGIGVDDVQSDTFEPYREELTRHVNLLVPLYGKFRLRFYLQSLSGHRIEWNASDVRIFTPVYKVETSTVECGYRASSKDEIDMTAPCPGGSALREIDLSRPQRETRSIGCLENTISDSEAARSVGLKFVSGMRVIRQSAAEGCSAIIRRSVPCPDSAVTTELACGPLGHREGVVACPPPDGATSPEWKAREQIILPEPQNTVVCQKRGDGLVCGDTAFESLVECPLVIPQRYQSSTAPFLFRTCGNAAGERGLETRLREEASKVVPPEVPVDFEMRRTGTLICNAEVDPEGCNCFKRAEVVSAERVLCAAGVRRDSAQVRSCCESSVGRCELVPTRLPSSTTKRELAEESLERARILAEEAAGAILGGFIRCDQKTESDPSQQCGQIVFNQDAVTATGSGQVEVPLRLLRLAPGEGTVSIGYTASRPLEEQRLRNSSRP